MRRPVLIATLFALAVPGAASAAPAATLSLAEGGTSVFNWNGGPGNGVLSKVDGLPGLGVVKCGDPTADCEDKLVKVEDLGDLTFDVHGDKGSSLTDQPDPSGQVRYDLDTQLYESDANGAIGALVGEGTGTGYDEQIVATALPPGYYILRTIFYESVQGTYKGSAKLTPYVEPEPDGEEE